MSGAILSRPPPASEATSFADRPEKPIESAQSRSWPLPFQDGHLLAKRDDLDGDNGAALEKDAGGGNQGEIEWQNGIQHDVTPRRPPHPLRKRLNSRPRARFGGSGVWLHAVHRVLNASTQPGV
jgi:hypothetical protein